MYTPAHIPCAVEADLRRYEAEQDAHYRTADLTAELLSTRRIDLEHVSDTLEFIDLNDHVGEIAAFLVMRRGGELKLPESDWPASFDALVEDRQRLMCEEAVIEADAEPDADAQYEARLERRRGVAA